MNRHFSLARDVHRTGVAAITFTLLALAQPMFAESARPTAQDFSPQNVLVFSSAEPIAETLRPKAGKPVYYLAMAGGYHHEGPPVAGDTSDKVPADDVWKPLQRALAAQGYRGAGKDTPPPSLLIVFHWGVMNPDIVPGDDGQTELVSNGRSMGALVGATRVDPQMSQTAEVVRNNATEDRYVVIVTAYDFAAATAKPRVKKMIWRTRLSVATAGTTLQETILPMIATGAAFLGRDSGEAKEIRWDKASVEIGEAKVVGYGAPSGKAESEKK
jgi:hypothetical protein